MEGAGRKDMAKMNIHCELVQQPSRFEILLLLVSEYLQLFKIKVYTKYLDQKNNF
jgi:hypothetical protein